MRGKEAAAYMIMAQMYAGTLGCGYERKEPGYKADWEPLRMKGLSAEEMGTANSRKKSRKKRKREK